MNGEQRKTLNAIFADPVSPSIAWRSVENLLLALGCNQIEGSSSRERFEKDGVVASFHRPHPDPTAKRYQIRDAREFLIKVGVQK